MKSPRPTPTDRAASAPGTRLLAFAVLAAASLSACDGPPDPDEPASGVQDILTTDLALDLATLEGRASLQVVPAEGEGGVWLETAGLVLSEVTVDGTDAAFEQDGWYTWVEAASSVGPVTVETTYEFPARTAETFDGWMPDQGVSLLWPYYCGNLFPCDSSPADGVTFTMEVTGFDGGLTAVFPQSTVSDAPSYMPGIALGDYERLDLGSTAAGTALHAWYLPGPNALAAAQAGTAHMVAVFDFLERTYGAYTFGTDAGSVEVDWGGEGGGMEHHPFSHIATPSFADEEVHVHEVAHGWFGDGVRIACWEDFVLSEGTTTWLAARAMEAVGGPDLWPFYVDWFLEPLCTGGDVNTIALPDTCGEIDLLDHDLWSLVPYMKGACFYEDVADLLGADVVDEVVGGFYRQHVGGAARMQDMIDALVAAAGPAERGAVETLATEWLRTLECPADYAARCRSHAR